MPAVNGEQYSDASSVGNAGNAATIGLFVAAGSRTIPLGTDLVRTSGYDRAGVGAARYVADPATTPAFRAAHPRAAFVSADGRGFRLAERVLTPDMFGAGAAVGVNDQPAIQGMADYSAATSNPFMALDRAYHELWTPVRTSPVSATNALDGHALVITGSAAIHANGPVRLAIRAPDGSGPEHNWQMATLDGPGTEQRVWRGGGIFLRGDGRHRDVQSIDFFRMDGPITVDGGTERTYGSDYAHTPDYPARLADGDGWDLTHKGLWVQDSIVGDIFLRGVRFTRFKGEILYGGGSGNIRSVELDHVQADTTNGDVLNILGTGAPVRISHCRFGNGFQAMEGSMGPAGSFMVDTEFFDCREAGTLWGGVLPPAGYPYQYPARPGPGNAPPTSHVDITIRNCVKAWLPGSWLTGRVRLVDTGLAVDTGLYGRVTSLVLDVDAVADRRDVGDVVTIGGPQNLSTPVPNAPAGTYQEPPTDVRIRLRNTQSGHAAALGIEASAPMTWVGIIGAGTSVTIESNVSVSPPLIRGGAVDLGMPLIVGMRGAARQTGDTFVAPSLTEINVVPLKSTAIGLAAGAGTRMGGAVRIYRCRIQTRGVPDGQVIRLQHADGPGVSFMLANDPANGMRLSTPRVMLAKGGDHADFRYDAALGGWRDVPAQAALPHRNTH